MTKIWPALVLALLWGACAQVDPRGIQDDDQNDSGPDSSGQDTASTDTSGNTLGCQQMDILFVIDDSTSMSCEQEMLVQSFPGFIDVLENYRQDNAPDLTYRIGVTSGSRTLEYILNGIKYFSEGMDGLLATPTGSSTPWIDGPGDLDQINAKFAEIATVGTEGAGLEMPLQCIALAIDKMAPGQPNEGFLRENSLGIVIVITDEDDCSRPDDDFLIYSDSFDCGADPIAYGVTPLGVFKSLLDETFGGEERYAMIAIAGEQLCESSSYATGCDEDPFYSGAREAIRLKSLIEDYVGGGASDYGLFSDICSQPLPGALDLALEKIALACDNFVIIE